MSNRMRRLIALGVTLAVLAPLGYLWATSLVPDDYSAAEMGYADYGGGPVSGGGHEHHGGMSVADLTGPKTGTPDVDVTLTARKTKYQLDSSDSYAGTFLIAAREAFLARGVSCALADPRACELRRISENTASARSLGTNGWNWIRPWPGRRP